jgi:hypothetical protein
VGEKRKEKKMFVIMYCRGGNIRIDTIAALYQQHTCKTPASQKVEEKRHFACCKVDTETSKFMVVIKQRRRKQNK